MSRFLLSVSLIGCLVLAGCAGAPGRMEEDRRQADVHLRLAEAHLQADNPSAALRELLQAVELNPNNAAVRASLAQAYQQRRAYTEAETNYLEALKLSGNDPRYENNLANLYLTMEEWDKAIYHFDRAAKNLLFDSTHIALTGKGYAHLQKGDYVSALQSFRDAATIMPGFVSAYFYQAEVYRLTGDESREIATLRRTIDLAPELLPARYRLAVLLLKRDNIPLARQHLEVIINFAPESDEGRMAAELIKTLPED